MLGSGPGIQGIQDPPCNMPTLSAVQQMQLASAFKLAFYGVTLASILRDDFLLATPRDLDGAEIFTTVQSVVAAFVGSTFALGSFHGRACKIYFIPTI